MCPGFSLVGHVWFMLWIFTVYTVTVYLPLMLCHTVYRKEPYNSLFTFPLFFSQVWSTLNPYNSYYRLPLLCILLLLRCTPYFFLHFVLSGFRFHQCTEPFIQGFPWFYSYLPLDHPSLKFHVCVSISAFLLVLKLEDSPAHMICQAVIFLSKPGWVFFESPVIWCGLLCSCHGCPSLPSSHPSWVIWTSSSAEERPRVSVS